MQSRSHELLTSQKFQEMDNWWLFEIDGIWDCFQTYKRDGKLKLGLNLDFVQNVFFF